VILLDIMMPGMDGWDTIRAILDNKLEQGVAIIMLTAKNVPDNKMIGLQEYVVDYITKPFDNEDLIEKTSFIMGYINDQRNSGTAE
jgi:DNA-binding response OmpR family regulator